MGGVDDFERGKREGRLDALVAEHTNHLGLINGSIERFAAGTEALAAEIRELRTDFRLQIAAADAAARALAAETERRRQALADADRSGDSRFSRRERLAGLVVAVAAVCVSVWLSVH